MKWRPTKLQGIRPVATRSVSLSKQCLANRRGATKEMTTRKKERENDRLRELISSRHNPDGFGPHVRGLMHVYCVQLERLRALSHRAFIPFSTPLPRASATPLAAPHSAVRVLRYPSSFRKHSIGRFRSIPEFAD